MDNDFDIIIDIEDVFNAILKSNQNLTPEQRIMLWDFVLRMVEDTEDENV